MNVSNASAMAMSEEKPPLREFCKFGMDSLEGLGQVSFLCGSAAMMVTLFIGNVMHMLKVTWLPESLVAVTFGAIVGFGLWASPEFGRRDHLDFDAEFLWFAVYLKFFALPLIISEAGWSLQLRDFFSQLTYILIFAILGTLVSIGVVASLMIATQDYHGVHDPQTAWAYASLISSVDPVATLATFGQLNVDRLLFILVFGESQINDAVAITMFDAFNSPFGEHSAARLVAETLWYLFGSIALGLLLATTYILMLRCGKMRHAPHQQILFLTVSSTFTYQLAEIVDMSGIITVLFCSIMLGRFAGPHLSSEGILLFSFILKQLASLCDMLIFVFVGVAAVKVTREDLILSLWIMLFVLLSRAVAVFLCGLLCNGLKYAVGKRLPAESRIWISWRHMVMMWHGGVCRGGVSLWMGTEMLSWVDDKNGHGTRQRLISATFVLICTFLLAFGGTTSYFMRWLSLPMGEQVPRGMTLYGEKDKDGKAWRCGLWLGKRVLRPLLVGKLNKQQTLDRKHSILARLQDEHGGRSPSRGAEIFELFGSTDPGHLDQIEEWMDESPDNDHEEQPSLGGESSSSESSSGSG